MFVVSGAAGLIFEVGLERALTRAFGVSALATATVLAAWMAGLAIGAVALGGIADRVRQPLRLYAALEVGIAVLAVTCPWLVEAAIAGFATLNHGRSPNATGVQATRVVLAFAITLLPSVLMGGTFPVVARALGRTEASLPRLYTANLIGASAGAAIAAYVLMPSWGLHQTLIAGAALNLVAAAAGLWLSEDVAPLTHAVLPIAGGTPRFYALAGWSGLITFAAEVTCFQILAVVVGNSAYAFGLMLSVFLAGLTLGSGQVTRLAQRRPQSIALSLVGQVQIVVGAGLLLTFPLWDRVSSIFALAGDYTHSFGAREAVRALVCFELLLLPTALLGAVYPLLLEVASRSGATGRDVGRLAAVNTVGAVLGSLGTGFVLLPLLGTHGMLVALTVATALVGAVLTTGRWRVAAPVIAVVALLAPGWDVGRLASGSNVYFMGFTPTKVLWSKESIASGLTTVIKHEATNVTTLMTNGKFQGNNGREIDAQHAFVQLPLLAVKHFDFALIIGVGTGCSLGTLAAAPFAHVDAAELSPDILEAADLYFSDINQRSLHNPKVTVQVADGRNLLLLADQKWDLVSIELSSVWIAGVADLYNREFYALVRSHLRPQGVLQQWVQLHHMTRQNLALTLATVHAEFPHVVLFSHGGQGIVVASADPLTLDAAALARLSDSMQGTAALEGVPGADLLTMAGKLVLDEAQVAAFVAEESAKSTRQPFLSTDDAMWLEYSTPRSNADDSLADPLDLLATLVDPARRPRLPVVANDEATRAYVEGAILVGEGRLDQARALLADVDHPRAKHLLEVLGPAKHDITPP